MLGVGGKVVPKPTFLSNNGSCSSIWGDSWQPLVPPYLPGLLPQCCRGSMGALPPSASVAELFGSTIPFQSTNSQEPQNASKDSPFGRANTGLGWGRAVFYFILFLAGPIHFPPWVMAMMALTPCSSSQPFPPAPSWHFGDPHQNADGYLHPSTGGKSSQWFPLACKVNVTSPIWSKAELGFQDMCPPVAVSIAG